jgi:hypothetical protein
MEGDGGGIDGLPSVSGFAGAATVYTVTDVSP